ncbi:MAG: NAD-dependent epimerase/dehydratase family protein [Clostridia bacterium]|nr:NAD-dependent epimerase/dehydratase family protein [Clostridia bacterium]
MKQKNKKICISGVAGFLGSYLAKHFLKEGYDVVGCDNLIGGYISNIPDEVKFYQYDCNDLDKMKEVTKGCDVVYHCAALAYEGLSVFSPNVVSKSIFGATTSILTASITNKVKRFIYCSSMARYGTNNTPFTEEMIPNPQDPYGISKYSAELMVRNLCEVHNIEYVIVVPHNIIGSFQKYDDPFRNVASIMINLMLQGKQPIIYGDGGQMRCFSFVNDVISCLSKVAYLDNVVGETINVGPDEEFITINTLAETIAKLLDFKLEPIYMKGRPQEVKFATCSANKARRLLNYSTKYTLEQGLQEIIDYIKKEGVKPFDYHLPIEILSEKTPLTWTNKLF